MLAIKGLVLLRKKSQQRNRPTKIKKENNYQITVIMLGKPAIKTYCTIWDENLPAMKMAGDHHSCKVLPEIAVILGGEGATREQGLVEEIFPPNHNLRGYMSFFLVRMDFAAISHGLFGEIICQKGDLSGQQHGHDLTEVPHLSPRWRR